ncbi:MAG: alpha/beta fold hydrolase [Oscillospiraceae bacterium]|nr:alpha/beta fold hydrolase [Oscillospiraceae bacterium]
MAWLIVLLSVVAFLLIVWLAAGRVAFQMSLTRPKPSKPSLNKKDNPEAQRQAELYSEVGDVGRAWFAAQNPQEVEIFSRDGLTLRGHYLPAVGESRKLVVFSHGYTADGQREFAAFFRWYHEQGFHFVAPDQRCHGRSEGKYIGFSGLEWMDIADWADEFAQRLGDDAQVVVHGMSMGAATVMNLNANKPAAYIKCVVADCGFSNGFDMMWLAAQQKMGMPKIAKPVMWSCGLWYKLYTGKSLKRDADPLGKAAKFARPTLFVCGVDDPFVPCYMTEQCHEAAGCEKELFLVPGAHHVMSYYLDRAGYEAKMAAWFAQWVKDEVAA